MCSRVVFSRIFLSSSVTTVEYTTETGDACVCLLYALFLPAWMLLTEHCTKWRGIKMKCFQNISWFSLGLLHKNTRGKSGIFVYRSCRHGDSVSVRMTVRRWIFLSFGLPSNESVRLQIHDFRQYIGVKFINVLMRNDNAYVQRVFVLLAFRKYDGFNL